MPDLRTPTADDADAPSIPLCSTTGKRQYTRDQSRRTAHRMKQAESEPFASYKCRDCGHYHVGHATEYRRKRLAGRRFAA